jgi:uncharacterized zinc-type alcohol dehydrogenase-like protein
MRTIGYAALSAESPLAPYAFERRDLRPDDVAMDILYCGVCHSDLHTSRNDWGSAVYPCLPGHEIVGRVTAIGPEVTRFKVGEVVAVGCLVDSCGRCDQCRHDLENYCREGWTGTYNGRDRVTGENTLGGYSRHILVREKFVLHVPEGLDIAKVGPLLCAGITTYSPLREWNVGPGSRVGVVGLGGLGHMAVKFAHALGARVTVLSRTPGKEQDAFDLGADAVLISTDAEAMTKAARSFDLIVDTVPVKHDINPYLPLLDIDRTMVVLGQVGPVTEPSTVPLIFERKRIAGSLIGGLAETQEMLNFCGRQNIVPEVEMIRMDQINEAYDRMQRSDVRYRFVIDMATLPPPA